MASSKLESTKKMIRSVLMSSKDGVPASKFDHDYHSLTQSRVKYETFGFGTLHELMLSMPDVVQVSNRGGVPTYHAVASKETQHIQKMVSKQASKKKKKKASSIKGFKPYQRFVFTAKHLSKSPGRHFGSPKIHKSSVGSLPYLKATLSKAQNQVRPRMHQMKPRKSSAPTQQTAKTVTPSSTAKDLKAYLEAEKGRKWTSKPITNSSCLSGFRIDDVIKNRIRTLLGHNPAGVFSNHLVQLYLEAYDCNLSESVTYSLECGELDDIAKVEKLVSGNRERYIIFPVQNELSKQVHDNEVQRRKHSAWSRECLSFSIDPEGNQVMLGQILEDRIKALLHMHPGGIASRDFKEAYKKNFDCDVPDSVLHGLECGIVKNVSKVETRMVGNRQIVTLFPFETCERQRSKSNVKKPPLSAESEDLIETDVKMRIKRIVQTFPSGMKLSSLSKIYYDAFQEVLDLKVIHAVEKGELSEFLDVDKDATKDKIILSTKKGKVEESLPKYPGISGTSRMISCAKSLLLGVDHDVLVMHIENCDHFCVQLTSSSSTLEKIFAAAEKVTKFEDLFSLEQGTYVMSTSSACPKRGKVLEQRGKLAKVLYVDYGETQYTSKLKLSPLPQELTTVPELAIFCSLHKTDPSVLWSERASSKFQQLCFEKRATIKVVSVVKKLVDGVERDVHIVSCHLGSLDVNTRLGLENESSSECKSLDGTHADITEKDVQALEEKEVFGKKNLSMSERISAGKIDSKGGLADVNLEMLHEKVTEEKPAVCEKGNSSLSKECCAPPSCPPSKKVISVLSDDANRRLTGLKLPSENQSAAFAKLEVCCDVIHVKQEVTTSTEESDVCDEKHFRVHPIANLNATSPLAQEEERSAAVLKRSGTVLVDSSCREVYAVTPSPLPFHIRQFGKFIGVQVTRVLTAEKFYMVPVERIPILKSLTQAMNIFYKDRPVACTKLEGGGSLYAAEIEVDGVKNWRRVVLDNTASNFASVFLVDIGEMKCIGVQYLRELGHEFVYVPMLAMIGRLAGVKPKENANLATATKLFENTVLNRHLVAHLTKTSVIGKSMVFDVCLFVDDGDGRGQWINDVMVDEWQVADYVNAV